MTDWLLTHQATLQSYLDSRRLRLRRGLGDVSARASVRDALGPRWFNQLVLTALGSLIVWLAMPLAAFALALLVQHEGWGLFNHVALPAWLTLMLGVIVIDLGGYAQHRLFHAGAGALALPPDPSFGPRRGLRNRHTAPPGRDPRRAGSQPRAGRLLRIPPLAVFVAFRAGRHRVGVQPHQCRATGSG